MNSITSLILLTGVASTSAVAEPTPQADLDRRIQLEAPLAHPAYSFFYASLGQPRLRGARALSADRMRVEARFSVVQSVESDTGDGYPNRFDGIYTEPLRLELGLGLGRGLEVYTAIRVAGWDERRDVFELRVDDPVVPAVRDEPEKLLGRSTSRHENLADWTIGAKLELASIPDTLTALAASLEVKLPIARQRDLTHAGTTDVAFSLLGSLDTGPVVLYANVGLVVPLGQQTIFLPNRGVRLEPFGHVAAGVSWRVTDSLVLGASIEASTIAWDGAEFLEEVPATVAAGARYRWGPVSFEVGGGTGLTQRSADYIAWGGIRFDFDAPWVDDGSED